MIPGGGREEAAATGYLAASVRPKDLSSPPPRALGEADFLMQGRVVYTGPFSLRTVAQVSARAVALLALTDRARIRPDLQVRSREDLDALLREAVPPMLRNEFVAEGLAAAAAERAPAVSGGLLGGPLRSWIREQARAARLTAEQSPGSFFEFLLARGDIRRLLASAEPDLQAAARAAYQKDLKDLEREWMESLAR
jgi:hypothetical protein